MDGSGDSKAAVTIAPEVAKAVNRFWEERGKGRAVSIDECLESRPGTPKHDEFRRSAIQTIAQQADVLAKVGSEGSGESAKSAGTGKGRSGRAMGPSDFAATMASVPEYTLSGALTSGGPLPTIEGYDLVASLGRGGMGAVFEGYQQSTGRRVAIKFMLDAMGGSESNRKRFEREVEVVARLQHPGIVSVIDSGVKRGRYYYVMDFVPGRPMDSVLDPGKCPVKQAMELIANVCDAVDYAHQRGILHRDLKPSNVIVDEKGLPHLLDFGLAKVFDPAAGDGGSHGKLGITVSGPGQLMGTVAYMAPEQAQGKHDETSVRTDVYSLGAIAYELVTGDLPSKTSGSLGEVLHRIIEVDPTAPSVMRKGAGISSDLDAVLLRALEKAPEARYATAGEFAADIRRALVGEPVVARRVGTMGRSWRWVKRNRAISAVAATGVATVIVVSTVLVARLFVEMANTSRALNESMESLGRFKTMLSTVDPQNNPGMTVLQLMDSATKSLDETPLKQDRAEAELREVLGNVYRRFGNYEAARKLAARTLEIREQQAKGKDDALLADALQNMAACFWFDGSYDQADPLYVRALEMRKRLAKGADNAAVADSLNHLAGNRLKMRKFDDARQLYVDTLEMRRRLARQGTTPAAKDGKSEQVAQALNNYGRYYIEIDDPVKAEGLFRDSLAMVEELRKGRENVGCAYALQNLGDSLMRESEEAEVSGDSAGSREKATAADAAYAEALAIRRKIYKNGNNLVCASMNGLARADLREGNIDTALKLATESVALYQNLYVNTLQADHPDVVDGRWTLALAEEASGATKDAISEFNRALEVAEKAKPRPEFVLTRLRGDLGLALAKTDLAEVGEGQLKRALDEAKARHKDGATEISLAARKLVEYYKARGEAAKAKPYLAAAKLSG